MGIVNRYAKGLLSFLDSQTQGNTPDSCAEQIVPTLDVGPFLAAQRSFEIVSATGVCVTAFDNFATITVPTREMWLIYEASVLTSSLDGTSGAHRASVYWDWFSGTFLQQPLAQTTNVLSLIPAAQSSATWTCGEMPLVLQAGQVLTGTVSSAPAAVTGLGWIVAIQARIIRLQA